MEKDAQREQDFSKELRLPCHVGHVENLTNGISRQLVGELVMLFGKLLPPPPYLPTSALLCKAPPSERALGTISEEA